MPKKILLADDSITIQKVVELTFSDGDYEVTAVNNGAKAVQKLAEMRPDIILSDIIMPEKNGYEVCEFVKSHPEYRNIPIILLTGTFEPFDPDRAEKAGCDAVVTKPFESQSLIHKVEELIAQASPASAPAEAPADQTWATGPAEPAQEEAPAPWGEPAPPPFGFSETEPARADLFGGADTAPPTVEVPYSSPQPSSPFLREEEPPAPPPASASPWEDASAYSGETRTFPKMSFEDFDKLATAAPPPPEPEPQPQQELESPFGAPPPAEEFSGETRAFTKLSFDDLQRMSTSNASAPEPEAAAEPPAPPPLPEPQPESLPWAEEPAAAAAPAWEEAPAEQASPWDDQQAYSGETRTFQRMSFDDLQKMAGEQQQPAEQPAWQAPAEEPAWEPPAAEEPAWSAPAAEEPAWAAPEEPSWSEQPAAEAPSVGSSGGFTEEAPTPPVQSAAATAEALPWTEPTEPAWQEEPAAPAAEEAASYPTEVPFQPPAEDSNLFAGDHAEASAAEEGATPAAAWSAPQEAAAPAASAAATSDRPFELTDEMVDRIARRVVELMSDQVIRNIAWEVIPDVAEIAVKDRIRQLEAEEV